MEVLNEKRDSEKQADTFPHSLVPGGLFEDQMEYVTPISEAPPEFHIFTLSHTISCLIGRSFYIVQGDEKIFPNLYTLIVAPSSLYKKTSSTAQCQRWLIRVDHASGYHLGHIGSPEGLIDGLSANGGIGFLYYSELGVLLAQSSKRYMAESLEMLNDLYDCPRHYSRRLSGQTHEASNIYLTFLAASQLDSLTRYIKESDLISGFLPRFTIVYSENLCPHIVRRPKPDERLKGKLSDKMKAIKERSEKEPQELDLTPQAWERFESWGHKRHKEAMKAPPQLKPMYGRIETHCLKYAIIIHAATNLGSRLIKAEVVSQAIVWADYVLESYRRLVMEELAFTEDDRKLKKIETIIKDNGTATRRDIVQATKYRSWEIDERIKTLKDMENIEITKGPKGGDLYEWIR